MRLAIALFAGLLLSAGCAVEHTQTDLRSIQRADRDALRERQQRRRGHVCAADAHVQRLRGPAVDRHPHPDGDRGPRWTESGSAW